MRECLCSIDVPMSLFAACAMSDRVLADAVLLVHGLFILFVPAGGALVWRWPRLAWLHLPAVAWGAWVAWAGWICPLTPLENALRRAAGQAGYSGGFIEHYLVGLIYPDGLTRGVQAGLGIAVALLNLALYALLLRARRRRAFSPTAGSRPRAGTEDPARHGPAPRSARRRAKP